jgi:sugar/nucleoside kinase (ribokinase family)
MLGQIGKDQEGEKFIKYLEENGVDYSGVLQCDEEPTG